MIAVKGDYLKKEEEEEEIVGEKRKQVKGVDRPLRDSHQLWQPDRSSGAPAAHCPSSTRRLTKAGAAAAARGGGVRSGVVGGRVMVGERSWGVPLW